MAFDKNRSAGFLANHMARLFANGLQRNIRPLGLAPAQFMTLLELWGEDGLTQRELVERLDVEQATMANTLTQDGARRADRAPRPSRGWTIAVDTFDREGDLPARTGDIAARAVNAVALGELSEEERLAFLDLTRRVIGSLKQRY